MELIKFPKEKRALLLAAILTITIAILVILIYRDIISIPPAYLPPPLVGED